MDWLAAAALLASGLGAAAPAFATAVVGAATGAGATYLLGRTKDRAARAEQDARWRQRVEDRLERLDDVDLEGALAVMAVLKAHHPELRLPLNRQVPIWDRRRKAER